MRSIDDRFYKTRIWQMVRDNYLKGHQFCERCLKKGEASPAVYVHHKVWLTVENVHKPEIAYGTDNLEALCFNCHQAEHHPRRRRFKVDREGRITPRQDPPL